MDRGEPVPDDDLDARIITAVSQDAPGQVAVLYACAANQAERSGDVDRACFFLTQAWIFALEAGAPDACALHARLVAYGRDVLWADEN